MSTDTEFSAALAALRSGDTAPLLALAAAGVEPPLGIGCGVIASSQPNELKPCVYWDPARDGDGGAGWVYATRSAWYAINQLPGTEPGRGGMRMSQGYESVTVDIRAGKVRRVSRTSEWDCPRCGERAHFFAPGLGHRVSDLLPEVRDAVLGLVEAAGPDETVRYEWTCEAHPGAALCEDCSREPGQPGMENEMYEAHYLITPCGNRTVVVLGPRRDSVWIVDEAPDGELGAVEYTARATVRDGGTPPEVWSAAREVLR